MAGNPAKRLQNTIFQILSILNGMRLVFSMASLLVISLLIFNGYANGSAGDRGFDAAAVRAQPIASAKNVNLVIQDTAQLRQQALEK
jgi:hypothetical protein